MTEVMSLLSALWTPSRLIEPIRMPDPTPHRAGTLAHAAPTHNIKLN